MLKGPEFVFVALWSMILSNRCGPKMMNPFYDELLKIMYMMGAPNHSSWSIDILKDLSKTLEQVKKEQVDDAVRKISENHRFKLETPKKQKFIVRDFRQWWSLPLPERVLTFGYLCTSGYLKGGPNNPGIISDVDKVNYVCPICDRKVPYEDKWHFASVCDINKSFMASVRLLSPGLPKRLIDCWRVVLRLVSNDRSIPDRSKARRSRGTIYRLSMTMYVSWVIYAHLTHNGVRAFTLWGKIENERSVDMLVSSIWKFQSYKVFDWLAEFQSI